MLQADPPSKSVDEIALVSFLDAQVFTDEQAQAMLVKQPHSLRPQALCHAGCRFQVKSGRGPRGRQPQ